MIRLYALLKTLINFVLLLISFFFVFRIVLKVFSTNPQTPFVAWVYSVSDFLISPFANITPNLQLQTGILDIVAIISYLAYLIAGYLLISLFQSFTESAETTIIEESEYPDTVSYHQVSKKRKG